MFWRPLDLSTHLHPVSSALVWDTPSPIPHDTSPSSPTWLEQWPPNWSSCFQHLPCMHRSTTRLLFSRPVVSDSLRPHGLHAACQAFLYFTISRSLLKLMSIESVMPSNHFVLCHPLLLSPSIFPSIRVFSNEPVLYIRWPKYWSFSFSIRQSSEYSGLISFRIDWLDLVAVQGTLKSLLQHHSSKASILQGSAFFMVQLSQPYVTTGKTVALTLWTFVGKVMSLLFNMLSRFVIAL